MGGILSTKEQQNKIPLERAEEQQYEVTLGRTAKLQDEITLECAAELQDEFTLERTLPQIISDNQVRSFCSTLEFHFSNRFIGSI